MGFLDNLLRKVASSVTKSAVKSATTSAKNAIQYETKTFTFDTLPTNVDELKAVIKSAMKDPFEVTALTIVALNVFPENREECYNMLNALKGPSQLLPSDKQFIANRFMDGKNYIPRSYFEGATPANNYKPDEPFKIKVQEQAYSRQNINEGYITLFVTSGGADSPRQIKLRTKPSTGEWFLWDLAGVLSGIRIPVSQNEWA